jgi:hypothetical protein
MSDDSDGGEQKPAGTSNLRDFKAKAERETQYVFPIDKKGQNRRRVTVSRYRGKVRVDIREYYQDEDEWKPGRKGVSLDLDQWRELVKLLPLIEEASEALSG